MHMAQPQVPLGRAAAAATRRVAARRRVAAAPAAPGGVQPQVQRRVAAAAALTGPALAALSQARAEASRHGVMFAGPEHLLLGLLATPGAAAGPLLSSAGVSLDATRARLDALHVLPQAGLGTDAVRDVDLSPALRSVMAAATEAAGGGVAGSAQLLAYLLLQQPRGGGLAAALQGADADTLLTEAQRAAADGPAEPAAAPAAGPGDAVTRLKQLYQEQLAAQQRGGGGGSAPAPSGVRQKSQQELEAEHNDIYE